MVASKARTLLRLARVQTMALTALAPVIGAVVFYAASGSGAWGHWVDLALLFMTGACLHVYGFVLNEWADVEVDRASGDLASKPLVAGEASPRGALAGALVVGMLGYVPLAIVSPSPWPVLLYTASLALGGAYDVWGKRAPLDAVLAGSLSALLLVGVATCGGFDPGEAWHRWLLALLLGLQFVQNLFQNAIEGGIKDADHDAAAGARTFAAITGTRVEAGVYRPTASFLRSALAMKLAQALLLLSLWVLLYIQSPRPVDVAVSVPLLVFALAVMVRTQGTFLPEGPFDRPRLKRLFSLHEMATYTATIAVLALLVGWAASLLLLALPVAWFLGANVALYGRPLEPGV
jgi:4-hydroxybenzoate polyprenyltransferase